MLNDRPCLQLMADRLYNEMAHGRIDDDWVEKFIMSIKRKLADERQLTEKEISKLEELFERY